MTDDLRARLNAALTAPHALDALERLVGEVIADLRAEVERLTTAGVWTCGHCSRPSRAHADGMASAECIYEPVWRPTVSPRAEARVAALETTLTNVRAQVLDPAQMATEGPLIGRLKVASMLDRVLDADGADTTTTDAPETAESRRLNCPVCGSGDFGDCICAEADTATTTCRCGHAAERNGPEAGCIECRCTTTDGGGR